MTDALAGKTVVVTRDEPDDGPLGQALRALGAKVQHLPCLETAPPEDLVALDRELARLPEYDWLLLTSSRAVQAIADRPHGAPRRVAAVGAATARAASEAGLTPDVVGDAGAAALIPLMAKVTDLAGATVFFPASERARPEAPDALKVAGAHVTQVTSYRILPREGAAALLRSLAVSPAVHALIFTSPSAAELLGTPLDLQGSASIAALGRTTADTLESAGWTNIVVPSRPDFAELARSLADTFRRKG